MDGVPNISANVGDAAALHTSPYDNEERKKKRKALKARLKKKKKKKNITSGYVIKRQEHEA